MNILFLDDDRERHAAFRATHPNDTIYATWTFAEFFRTLISISPAGSFDEVHLDHDIGDVDFHGNGQLAAHALALLPAEQRPARVHIHSWNMTGALRMMEILKNAGYNPTWEPFNERTP
jgi:hypothetical protein